MQDAAHAWAWNKKYTIKTDSFPTGDGLKELRITLVKRHRNRDYA